MPTVLLTVHHISHFSPSAAAIVILSSPSETLTEDTIKISARDSSILLRNSKSAFAVIATLASRLLPLFFSALASSRAYNTLSRTSRIFAHFSSTAAFAYSLLTLGISFIRTENSSEFFT